MYGYWYRLIPPNLFVLNRVLEQRVLNSTLSTEVLKLLSSWYCLSATDYFFLSLKSRGSVKSKSSSSNHSTKITESVNQRKQGNLRSTLLLWSSGNVIKHLKTLTLFFERGLIDYPKAFDVVSANAVIHVKLWRKGNHVKS